MNSTVELKEITQRYIERLATFSCYLARYPKGINRLAFTPAENDAFEWARKELERFGYICDYDIFLNLHAYDPRMGNERIIVGTHLDTVINAGKYDGSVGFITFLMSLHILRKEEKKFVSPVDFVIFRAEESTIFKEALLGSKVATGLFDIADLMKKVYKRTEEIDPAYSRLYEENPKMKLSQNWTVLDLLQAQSNNKMDTSMIKKGCWLFTDQKGQPQKNYQAYFEVHIEQGKVLQTHSKKIGVVTSIRAPLRYLITLTGQRDHSGGTPMGREYRRDSLCAASECILSIERICNRAAKKGVDIVGTVGVINVPGMGINIVPGECNITIDLRSNNTVERKRIFDEIKKEIENICLSRGIQVAFEKTEESSPVTLISDNSLNFYEELETRISELGYPWMRLPSGAGHDAMRMAQVGIPVCLLFIPCKDGISHSPDEFASTEDVFIGAKVLEHILINKFKKAFREVD